MHLGASCTVIIALKVAMSGVTIDRLSPASNIRSRGEYRRESRIEYDVIGMLLR